MAEEQHLDKADVYFSVADGQVTALAEEEGFTKALVHAALVDSRLVIPDVFFFNSPGLYQHTCSRSDKSLLETAMEAGLIIPALRTPASSFSEISTHLAEQRIVGLASEHQRGVLAARLDEASNSLSSPWVEWPAALGASYNTLLGKLLQSDDAPRFGSYVIEEEVWRGTQDLRFDAIDLARERRRAVGENDVRRGEIIAEAGRILGVLDGDEQISDLAMIMRRVGRLYPRGSLRYVCASSFFEWLDELYRFNQADRLDVQPTMANGRPSTLCLLAQAYRNEDRQPTDEPPRVLSFDAEVDVPSFTTLSRLDVKVLLELREFGRNWRAQSEVFLASPTERTRQAAQRALDEYAASLRKKSKRAVLQTLRTETLAGAAATIATEAADGVMTVLQTNVPVASIVAVLSGGYIAAQYLRKSSGKERIDKHLWQPRDIRIAQSEDPNVVG